MIAEADYLPLSDLQHFAFCKRQWALIQIEAQWSENLLTVQGDLFHEKVHSPTAEKRKETLLIRGLRVCSRALGVSGVCDVAEFHADPAGISLSGRRGTWQPYPIEYKRGRPKTHRADELQLCCQAMCLEEMLCCEIPRGALFYGESRRRKEVEFTQELRQTVQAMLAEMHGYVQRGYTPRVKPQKGCASCSLQAICLPELMQKPSVKTYMAQALEEGEDGG